MPTTTGIATEFITFTRASNATLTDSDGKVKWAPHNLLTNSESFDAAAWAKSSVTPTANSIAAPNGTTTADTLAASGANGTTLQTFTAEAISYTFGVWLKRKTGTGNIQIAADSGTYTTVTITSDWALYTVTQTPTAGSKTAGIRIVTSADEVYAWGAHLYRSDLGGMQPNTSAYPLYNPTTPKNLLGYSEDFSNAAWVAASSGGGTLGVKTRNYGTAPDGSLTATRIQLDVSAASAFGQSQVYQSFASVNGTVYNRSAWVKTTDGSTKTIMGFQAAGSTPSTLTVTGEWTRLSSVRTANGTTDFLQFILVKGTTSDTADLLVWHPQVSDSASLDAYVPSYGAAPTAAAYYGPRRDFESSGVCKGLLVEEQRTNAVTYSSDFSNAVWNASSFRTLQVTTGAAIAPDGTLTGNKAVEAAAGAGSVIQRVVFLDTTASAQKTLSVYAKKSERKRIYLFVNGPDDGGWFDLDLGTYGAGTDYPGATSINMVPVGNGWYRCSLTPNGASNGLVQIAVITNTATTLDARVGDGTSGVFIWGAQLEAGSFATSYIPTGAATATRSADVATVSTQAFPYSSTEGTLVVNGALSTNGRYAGLFNTSANQIEIYQSNATTIAGFVYASGSTQAGPTATANAFAINKAALAFKENDVAFCANNGSVVTDNTAIIPVVTSLVLNANVTSVLGSGHIRQITYIPRRLSNTELQTRTA